MGFDCEVYCMSLWEWIDLETQKTWSFYGSWLWSTLYESERVDKHGDTENLRFYGFWLRKNIVWVWESGKTWRHRKPKVYRWSTMYDSPVESAITSMIGSWKDILLCSSPLNLDSARWFQFSGQTQGLLIGKGCIAKMCSMLGKSRNEALRQQRQSFPSDSFPFCNPIHPDIWNIIAPLPDIWSYLSLSRMCSPGFCSCVPQHCHQGPDKTVDLVWL